MELAFNIIQIVLALALTGLILLQQKSSGLGSAFGGDSSIQHTRRGAEKGIYILTIIVSALFLGVAFANAIYIS